MLLKSKHASQVRGLLQDLDYDDLNSIVSASTNGKIEATTKKEAIDIILMNTSDLGRFFAYRRITCDVLFKYLNKLQAKNKKIELPMRTRKAEMILIIKDFWNENLHEAQSPVVNENLHEAQRPVVRPKQTVTERASPINITNVFNHISFGVPSASNFQFELDISLPSTSSGGMRSDRFGVAFCDWFYKMVNKLQPIFAQQEGDIFSERVFLTNSSVNIFIITNETLERIGTGQIGSYLVLKNTLLEFELLFCPNLETGLQIIRGEHGTIRVSCCGTLQRHNGCIGIYEQEFNLVYCPVDKRWKIMNTKLNLKYATIAPQLPSLPPSEIFEVKG